MKRIFITILLCASLCATAAGQTGPVTAPAESLAVSARESTPALRQETFDFVWRTVKDKHFDPTFGGVNWDRVRQEYAPRMASIKNDGELYKLLQQMLGELRQSHFNIIPPEAIVDDSVKEPPNGGVGLNIQMLDGLAVITHVAAGSPAEREGLRQGFVIKKIDDTTVEQIIERFAKAKYSPAMKNLLLTRAVNGRIQGKPETAVRLQYLDEKDHAREATFQRERLKGEMSQRFGNFPPQYTEFESKRLDGGIGYIRFNIFVPLVMERIRAAIRSMSDAPGIIFDLRGNPGGLGGMSSAIAGMLEQKQTSLGTMKLREGQQNFVVFPQQNPYTGPVVILIDGGSASTSEIFAGGMQENGRAVIVGQRSPGAALPSVFVKLPTGALFQYAIADFKTPKGVIIEGRGVKPDIEVKLSRKELLKGHDSQLDTAIKEVQKRTAQEAKKAAA